METVFGDNGNAKHMARVNPNVLATIKKNINVDFSKISTVIDAGCGYNVYKSLFPNLTGFDINYYTAADMQCDFLTAPFEESSADLVLVLGSNQFISLEAIEENYKKAWSWVKPGGYLLTRFSTRNEAFENLQSMKSFSIIESEKIIGISPNWLDNLFANLNATELDRFSHSWGIIAKRRKQRLRQENPALVKYVDGLRKEYRLWKKNV